MNGASEVTAVLYVRSLTPAGARGRQEAVIDRLRALCDRGRLGDVEVRVWGDQVGLSTTAARTEMGKRVLERIAECREWADATGRSLEPFFERKERSSSITGESYTALDLPLFLLVEYRDGAVRHAAPCQRDASADTCRVTDRLATLEQGAVGAGENREDERDGVVEPLAE
jgi:hypothetical protein